MFETAMFLELMEKLCKKAYDNSKAKGFWDEGSTTMTADGCMGPQEVKIKTKPINIPEKLCLIHSEVSEWLEAYRKGDPICEKNISIIDPQHRTKDDPIGHRRITVQEEEAADILIRLCDLCHHLGIDLGRVTLAKMAYNESRPHMHGGKKC